MTFQKTIQQAYIRSKLSGHLLAKALGVSYVTLWRWRNGVCQPREDAIEYWLKKINKISL